MKWHLSRNWNKHLLIYLGGIAILFFCSLHCLFFFSVSSVHLSWSLCPARRLSWHVWWSLAEQSHWQRETKNHIDKEKLKTGEQLPVWLGLSVVTVTLRWPGGTLAFSLGSSFLWDCWAFPEKNLLVSCLEVVRGNGSAKGRQSHTSVIHAFT